MGLYGSKEEDPDMDEQSEPLKNDQNDKNQNVEKDEGADIDKSKEEKEETDHGIKTENVDDVETDDIVEAALKENVVEVETDTKQNVEIEDIEENDKKVENNSTETLDKDTSTNADIKSSNNNVEAKDTDKVDDKDKGDDVIVTVAGKDDVDAASTYSLFMEKDFRYYFQHPYCRLFFAYFVVFCNFLIYAEDPVAHSIKECLIPMIGNDFSFVGNRYPPNAWSLLKVIFWLIGIAIGMVVGKLLVHGLLFSKYFISQNFSYHLYFK